MSRPFRIPLIVSRALASAVLLLAAAGGVLGGSRSGMAGEQAPAYAPGEVLVKFRPSAGAVRRAGALSIIGGRLREAVSTAAMRAAGDPGFVRIETARDVPAAVRVLRRNPAVEYAEPNWRCYAAGPDPFFTNGSLWGMYGPTSTPANQYGSGAAEAWAGTHTGSRSVVVGVIDEGMDYTHPDLAANIWTNPGEVPGNGIDDDGNGYVDDVHGWDFWHRDNTVFDGGDADGCTDRHGTHVAGTIGAIGSNDIGVAGMNWNVSIISCKFLGPPGGYTSDAVRALDYLTDLKTRRGINIVASSNSWGGGGYSQSLHDAVIRAARADILFIAAAGNSGVNTDTTANYPSCLDTSVGTSSEPAASYDSVISVAAIDSAGNLAGFSNYGALTVDLGAPGVSILSTQPANSYAYFSGTSMATPHVSGAAALYAAEHPGCTALEIRKALLRSVAATPSLAGKTATGGRLYVGGNFFVRPNTASATFLTTDTGTEGNWKGVYGKDGYRVLQDSASYPGYATVSTSGTNDFVWNSSAANSAALQRAGTGRISAGWYNASSMTVNLNLTDGNPHQVGLYFQEWDYPYNRVVTVDVLERASGKVLDTQTAGSFQNGVYLLWNLQGDLQLRLTRASGPDAIVSGLFFDPAGTPPPPVVGVTPAASFLFSDSATRGSWKGAYGKEGYQIIQDAASYPAYARVSTSGTNNFVWSASTTALPALQKASASDRISAGWYNGAGMTVNLNLTDGKSHQVGIYFQEADYPYGRAVTVDVLDRATGNVLDTRTAGSFANGLYLFWNLQGDLQIRLTRAVGPDVIVSGLFFDAAGTTPPPASTAPAATFVKTDTATQGSWKGVYGKDGYNVLQNSINYPAYARVSAGGTNDFVWSSSTTAPAALQKAGASDRISAGWYNGAGVTVNLNLTDGKAHQVALYFQEWDYPYGRTAAVDILDRATGAVLSTQSVSSFRNGAYLVWNMQGDLQIRLTRTAGPDVIVSGLFFD